MSYIRRVEVRQFKGVATDAHKANLPPEVFQTDAGGDRFTIGSWQTRRGRRHTDVAVKAADIDLIIGFNMPDGVYGYVIGWAGSADGHTDIAQQASS